MSSVIEFISFRNLANHAQRFNRHVLAIMNVVNFKITVGRDSRESCISSIFALVMGKNKNTLPLLTSHITQPFAVYIGYNMTITLFKILLKQDNVLVGRCEEDCGDRKPRISPFVIVCECVHAPMRYTISRIECTWSAVNFELCSLVTGPPNCL